MKGQLKSSPFRETRIGSGCCDDPAPSTPCGMAGGDPIDTAFLPRLNMLNESLCATYHLLARIEERLCSCPPDCVKEEATPAAKIHGFIMLNSVEELARAIRVRAESISDALGSID